MNVDGIMVLATGSTKEYEEVVEKLQIPILFLGQRFPGANSIIMMIIMLDIKLENILEKRF